MKLSLELKVLVLTQCYLRASTAWYVSALPGAGANSKEANLSEDLILSSTQPLSSVPEAPLLTQPQAN